MPESQKTHREVKNPQISARHLADFMAGSHRAQRSIVRNCKYQTIARVIQHDEAKSLIAKIIREGEAGSAAPLKAKAPNYHLDIVRPKP